MSIKQLAMLTIGALVLWQIKVQMDKTKHVTSTASTFKDMGNGVTVDSQGQWWQGGQIIYTPKSEWLA